MARLFANNAYGTLASQLSNVGTSITLLTGNGARFPSPTGGDYFNATLIGLDGNGNESTWEIVKVTARSNDVLTVVRAQESTTAATWNSGTRIELRATAGSMTDFEAKAPTASPTFTGYIGGDFSNATPSNRTAFRTVTVNGVTIVGAVPNGTGNSSYFAAYNSSDPNNAAYAYLAVTGTAAVLNTAKVGTGTALPLHIDTDSAVRALFGAAGGVDFATGLREAKVAVAASAIDLLTANFFTKTISGTTTFTVTNVPASGTTASFILDLTNGGSATINWWSGMKWASGTAPTLTASGRDVLGFFTHDGGTTWTGLLLAKDVK